MWGSVILQNGVRCADFLLLAFRDSGQRKRKRVAAGSTASLAHGAADPSKRRIEHSATHSNNDASLRIRYQNGQSEDIPLSAGDQLTAPDTETQRAVSCICERCVP